MKAGEEKWPAKWSRREGMNLRGMEWLPTRRELAGARLSGTCVIVALRFFQRTRAEPVASGPGSTSESLGYRIGVLQQEHLHLSRVHGARVVFCPRHVLTSSTRSS